MSYTFFLFLKLVDAYYPNFIVDEEDVPYDVQYSKYSDLHYEFMNSKFNNNNKSAYECIEEFIIDRQTSASVKIEPNSQKQDLLVGLENIISRIKSNEATRLWIDEDVLRCDIIL